MATVVQQFPDAERSEQSGHAPDIACLFGKVGVAATLTLCLTAPAVILGSGLPWLRAEQLALIPVCLVYLWCLLVGLAEPLRPHAMFVIGAAYCVCILTSLAYGAWGLGHPVLYRDFYEIPKALLPVLFFTLGFETGSIEKTIRWLYAVLLVGTTLVCLYAWAQWFDLDIARNLSRYYSGGEHIDVALAHYRRVYSTMGNPNVLAQLLTWLIGAFALAASFRIGYLLFNLAMLSMCGITLVMTGSRYGLMETALGLMLVLALSLPRKNAKWKTLVILVLVVAALATASAYLGSGNRPTLDRLLTLSDPLRTDSVQERLNRLWRDASHAILQSPWFGHGPAKALFTGIITDSEHLDVLKEFGFFGFVVYACFFVYPLTTVWKGIRASHAISSRDPDIALLSWAAHLAMVMVVTAVTMGIGMSVLYNEPLRAYFWIWMGVGASASRALRRFSLTAHPETLS